jgi:hypothetical protein
MSTCNWLDLQTLRSQPIMPETIPSHWLHVGICLLAFFDIIIFHRFL